MPPVVEDRAAPPTRWKAGLFLVKARAFQAARALREAGRRAPPRFQPAATGPDGNLLAESRTSLYPSQAPGEFALQAGKVQNLRIAAARLDGVIIPRGQIFSFWAHVPRPTRRAGFALGRELREGCVIPAIGGGLCQLSNALYDVALRAGCEIVERHAHSRRVPGSMAAADRDATVFWNYVDLRFRPSADCRLEVRLTRSDLIVRLRALSQNGVAPTYASHPSHLAQSTAPVESCETCGVAGCFRHSTQPRIDAGITAWLVDGWWPEFDLYLQQHRNADDWLFLPLRFPIRNYRWNAQGFARIRHALFETLRRSWLSRRLAAQGAERQRALLRFDEQLAARYLRQLPVDAMHLVVSQNLLPHLWRTGALGGRTFDVLMTRLPMLSLQVALDRAAAAHPHSATLVDFRAPPNLAAAEATALSEARHWITPHSLIARLAGPRAIKLPWQIPSHPVHPVHPVHSVHPVHPSVRGKAILFPASTLARKGALELAHVARELHLPVQLAGPILENAECWRGVETTSASSDWSGVGIVVLPAWVEHQPRLLLRAIAAGLPVIATEACGLAGIPGVTIVPDGNIPMLTDALLAWSKQSQA